jgi:hypothetical protein
MSRYQIALIEQALCELAGLSRADWAEVPADLQPSFAKYMSRDVWAGTPDLFDLRHAALMIVRDAIARTGEFAEP